MVLVISCLYEEQDARLTSDGGGSSGQGEDAEDVGEHFEGYFNCWVV